MARKSHSGSDDKTERSSKATAHVRRPRTDVPDANPPRTTKGGITAPKFGSAGSGGAEYEPGPERD